MNNESKLKIILSLKDGKGSTAKELEIQHDEFVEIVNYLTKERLIRGERFIQSGKGEDLMVYLDKVQVTSLGDEFILKNK